MASVLCLVGIFADCCQYNSEGVCSRVQSVLVLDSRTPRWRGWRYFRVNRAPQSSRARRQRDYLSATADGRCKSCRDHDQPWLTDSSPSTSVAHIFPPGTHNSVCEHFNPFSRLYRVEPSRPPSPPPPAIFCPPQDPPPARPSPLQFGTKKRKRSLLRPPIYIGPHERQRAVAEGASCLLQIHIYLSPPTTHTPPKTQPNPTQRHPPAQLSTAPSYTHCSGLVCDSLSRPLQHSFRPADTHDFSNRCNFLDALLNVRTAVGP